MWFLSLKKNKKFKLWAIFVIVRTDLVERGILVNFKGHITFKMGTDCM